MKDIGYGLLTIVYFAGAAVAVALVAVWAVANLAYWFG